jgi:uncharacterized protein (TIGR00725 family)
MLDSRTQTGNAMAKTVIGIMGPGETATAADCDRARELGRLIALKGWVLLTGGRPYGVMNAALEGAKHVGGLTVGILPSGDFEDASNAVDIPVLTGMGEARNVVNVLSSRVVIVCGMGAGTASEAALAIKTGRSVIFVGVEPTSTAFFSTLGKPIYDAQNPEDAIRLVESIVGEI